MKLHILILLFVCISCSRVPTHTFELGAAVVDLAFSQNGDQLVALAEGASIHVWNIESGAE